MLEIGVIGIGNCGNQVVALAQEELKCDVIALNSSKNDLDTIPDTIPSILVGDERGAGKNRKEAKLFLKGSIMKLIENDMFTEFMKEKDMIFIVSSTGGGTGSGMAPMLSSIIRQSYHDEDGREKIVILMGVLPKISEAYSTQVNTLEYCSELMAKLDDPTYIMYDNDRLSKEPTHVMMKTINESIIQDIKIMRGDYNMPTPYSSIDEKDSKMMYSTPGRIFIARLMGLKEKDVDEKTLEELLIEQIKRNTHCEMDRDKVVQRTGVITNLSEALNNNFDTHLNQVQEFVGSPVEEFEHVVINQDRSIDNNVFFIMTGLTGINDRINKVKDRIEEIEEAQKAKENADALSDVDINSLNEKRKYRDVKDNGDAKVSLTNIFNNFDV